MIVVLEHHACRVATRVGGVVVSAVVIHRPIEELQAAILSPGVQVEKIHYAEFADADFNAARGEFRHQPERATLRGDAITAQRDYLADHDARDVRSMRELWISYHIEVGEPRQAERFADPMAARALQVEKHLRRVRQLVTQKERDNLARRV